MNRIESLVTARMALGVALVMVLGAVIIPLPQPPRPVVAQRLRQEAPREDRVARRSGNPLSIRNVVPDAATAPRTASRLDDRTAAGAPPFPADRTASRDDVRFDVRPTPLQPVAESPARETLPPPPQDPEPVEESVPQIRPRAPRIELGPIDDTRAPKKSSVPLVKTSSTHPTPDERLVSVNVVLNGENADPSRQSSAEAVSRLEARLEAMQQRLEELSHRGNLRSTEESRQTNQLLERVESMVSLAEVQRKIDALQRTIEETRRAQATLEFEAASAPKFEPRRDRVAEESTAQEAIEASEPAEPAPSISPAMDDVPATFGDAELPQIHPGPPYAPTPVERTTAPARPGARVAAPIVRPRTPAALREGSAVAESTPKRAIADSKTADATNSVVPSQAPPESIPPAAEPLPAVSPAAKTEDEPIDVPLSRQASCYEYQLASKCFAAGDLAGARRHVRRAMAHDPKSTAARQLDERIAAAFQSPTPLVRQTQPAPARSSTANPAMISTMPRRNTAYGSRTAVVQRPQPASNIQPAILSEEEGYIGSKPLILEASAESERPQAGAPLTSDVIPLNLFDDEPVDTESVDVEADTEGVTESP